MKVLLDTNALIYLLDPRTPKDIQARLVGLVQEVESARGEIILPAQVIAEYLTKAGGAGEKLLDTFLRSKWVVVAPFDHVAAVECAAINARAIYSGNKRAPLGRSTAWQKVKVDRQIVAIAKVRRARIIADDQDIIDLANDANLAVQRVASLPIPEGARQLLLEPLEPRRATPSPQSQVAGTSAAGDSA